MFDLFKLLLLLTATLLDVIHGTRGFCDIIQIFGMVWRKSSYRPLIFFRVKNPRHTFRLELHLTIKV